MPKKKNRKSPLSRQFQSEKAVQRQEGKIELAEQVVGIVQQSFSGPIPPPGILDKYNKIIPNGAERIMVMAEEQSVHRRTLEKKALDTDSRNSLLGVIFAFTLGMTALVMGGIITLNGYHGYGFFMSISGLASIVTAFIYGTRSRRKEREAKAKAKM